MKIPSTTLLCVLFLQLVTLSSTALAYHTNSSSTVIYQLTEKATITGSVTSAQTKLPIAGVTVSLKGSSLATITDSKGNFSLEITDPSKSTIVFFHENYEQLAVKVANQSVITVSLSEIKLVTTALGIKRKPESLSYSLTEIKGDELTNVAQENFLNSLAGRVAGLSISQTSGIGSSVNVALRGIKSLSNDNQPLYVVDGVQMFSPLNNVAMRGTWNDVDYGSIISAINPEDIESISILKGTNSTALYGSRGRNGAILITTKSGQKGKQISVHFSTSNLIEKPYRFLDYNYKFANGQRPTLNERSPLWYGPELDKGIMAVQWNSPLDANGNPVPTELKSYKNNVKNFLQSAITTLNNLSVSGAAKNVTYRVGMNMMRNQGLVPGSDLYRNGVTTSLQYQPVKVIKITSNLSFTRNGSGSAPSTSNTGANPIEAAYAYSHVDVRELKEYWQPGQKHIEQRTVNPAIDNPYFLAKGINNSYRRDHYFGNLKVDYQIIPSLSIYARITHNRYSEERETKIPWGYSRGEKGGYYFDDLGIKETNIESMLSYQTKIFGLLEFEIATGVNKMTISDNNFESGGKLSSPGVFTPENIESLMYRYSQSNRSTKSLMNTLAISYKNQLFLDILVRRDWLSALPVDNSFLTYPSIGVSWLLNQSFKLPEIFSLLKLRTSFSKDYWEEKNTSSSSFFIQPDRHTTKEFGFEANLFQNRFHLDASYSTFDIKTEYLQFTAPSTNYGSVYSPIGLGNRSLEIAISGTPVLNKSGWTVDATLNFTHSRTRATQLYDYGFITLWEQGAIHNRSFAGDNLGDIYSNEYLKVTDRSSPYYQWPILGANGKLQGAGYSEQEKVGNIYPNFTIGNQLTISFKKFCLSASIDWRNGGQFVSATYRYAGELFKSNNWLTIFPGSKYSTEQLVQILKSDPEKYIIPQKGNFPLVGGYSQETGGYPQSYDEFHDGGFIPGVQLNPDGSYREHLGEDGTQFIPLASTYPWRFGQANTFDADFIKLREIALTYTTKIGKIKNAQFSIYSRNIMLWTKAKIGIDPERTFLNTNGKYLQGVEYQNINPWTIPIGFKVSITI